MDRRRNPSTATYQSIDIKTLSATTRQLTLYDVVAGRASLNGFLTPEQLQEESILPLLPEEVLHGRRNVPKNLIANTYATTDNLLSTTSLPQSEMLKAIHTYASDFYATTAREEGKFDFNSLDETALIAMGILIEETVREALGENGDMVFVEPEGLDDGLDKSKLTKFQVVGEVKPLRAQFPDEVDGTDDDSLREDESPAKKQRR
jgi:hypothetical protein